MMGSLRTPGTLTLAATPGRGARDTGNSNACLITACTVVKPESNRMPHRGDQCNLDGSPVNCAAIVSPA